MDRTPEGNVGKDSSATGKGHISDSAQADQEVPPRDDQPAGPPFPERPPLRIAFSTLVQAGIVFWSMLLVGIFFTKFIDVMLVIFLTILFSTFISPLVDAMERLHLHRGVSVLLIYLFLLGILVLIGALALPLFISETQTLLKQLPTVLEQFLSPLRRFGISVPVGGTHGIDIMSLFTGGGRSVTGLAGQALGLVFTVGTFLAALLSILVMAFFLTVQKTVAADLVNILLPPAYRRRTAYILSRMGERMGNWVIGQVIITIYYAVAFSAGLTLLHLPYSVSVGVITGVLEIIPFIGGFIGAGLALIIAATVSPTLFILVIVLCLIVTNVEAHILVPNI